MKFCTCTPALPHGSYNHDRDCVFFKVRPETKDEKIARLEKRLHEASASEILLHVLMERTDVASPVEVSVETYDDPSVRIVAKVWTHRKDNGIVWAFGQAQWLSDFTRGCDESPRHYMKDLGRKAEVAYEKAWSGK
jgi:hypothetical protein